MEGVGSNANMSEMIAFNVTFEIKYVCLR